MRPYSGRLRPRDVRSGSGAQSTAVPLLIPPAVPPNAIRPRRNPNTNGSSASQPPQRPPPPSPQPPGVPALGKQLCERGLPAAQVLVYIHQLNTQLTQAPSLDKVRRLSPVILSLGAPDY
jgi:hypothetical protein